MTWDDGFSRPMGNGSNMQCLWMPASRERQILFLEALPAHHLIEFLPLRQGPAQERHGKEDRKGAKAYE